MRYVYDINQFKFVNSKSRSFIIVGRNTQPLLGVQRSICFTFYRQTDNEIQALFYYYRTKYNVYSFNVLLTRFKYNLNVSLYDESKFHKA